ncbi:MAG: hypothetical protein H7A32_02710 [Deltaproteobacteria bacterium]|nr:hypothetical protein [Deltaproteobacteria bacterium]
MKASKKKIYLIVGILVGSFILSSVFLIYHYQAGLQASKTAEIFFSKHPYYLQNNPEYAKVQLSQPSQSLASHGSATLALSMALDAMGWKSPPAELAPLLLSNDAYSPEGEPKWYSIAAITGEKLEIEMPSSPNHNLILKSLKKGQPVIAQIENKLHGKHWVMIAGKTGSKLIIKNPLSVAKAWETIESPTTQIHKILILKKRGQWSL